VGQDDEEMEERYRRWKGTKIKKGKVRKRRIKSCVRE
jgi:hypothetical protein